MPNIDGTGRDLRDYLVVLRDRKRIIVVTLLLTTISALVLSSRQERVYEGRARVLVSDLATDSSLTGGQGAQRVDPGVVQTQAEVIESGPVKDAVRRQLGAAPDVSVTPVGETEVIEIKARNRVPRRAADIANAYAQAYVDFRQQTTMNKVAASIQGFEGRAAELQTSVDALTAELAAAPSCVPAAPAACQRRDELQRQRDDVLAQQFPIRQRLDQLRVEASVASSGVQVIATADTPRSPVSPKPVRDALIGALLGLLVGAALALVYEHFHEGINTAEDLERAAPGLRVLGVIPAVKDWRRQAVAPATGSQMTAADEAYRSLRTSILHLRLGRPLRVIQFTSPSGSEGKTTTAMNLAVSIAETGKSVLVIDGDLRRPRIESCFGVPNDVGLTSLLVGEVTLDAVVRPAERIERVSVLPAGPTPPNPSELLSSNAMLELIDRLSKMADFVIIDCPPVLPVTDAVLLSEIVDGTVLVAMAGESTRKTVARAVRLLHQIDAPIIGLVLNAAGAEDTYGDHYGNYSGSSETDLLPPDRARPQQHLRETAPADSLTIASVAELPRAVDDGRPGRSDGAVSVPAPDEDAQSPDATTRGHS
jgi:receptor protein-tyrosine kinase